MKHLTPARLALLFACWAGLASAQQAPDAPALYAHAMPLTVSGKNAVVQLRLPPAVYLNAHSEQLNDLRVFDAAGKALPFALIEQAAQAQASRRELPVKLFPVALVHGSGGDIHSGVDIKTSPDGTVTSISTRYTASSKIRANGETLGSLVLDVGQAPGAPRAAIDALAFTLPAGMSNYNAQVELEVSDDLRSWETLGYASLNWLANSNSETLSNNRMEFGPRAFRYARLSWREGTPVQFAKIVAEAPLSTELAPHTDSVILKAHVGRFNGDLVYDAAPAIPVQRLGLRFAEQNVVMPALLGQYAQLPSVDGAATTKWEFRPRMQATFFQISQDGKLRSAADVAVDQVHAGAWVLRPQVAIAGMPELRLSWTPATMVFMTGGSGPYTLAFGRDRAKPAQMDVAQVAPGFSAVELQALEQAVPGALQANSVKSVANVSDAEAAGSAAHGRVALLWAVLLLGVGVLGFMAWKLLAQMKQPD